MSISKTREFRYYCLKKLITREDLLFLEQLSKKIDQIKSTLIKTPLIIDSDIDKLEKEENDAYAKLFSSFEEFCQFFTTPLDEYINKVQESHQEEKPEEEKKENIKKGGKGDQKGAKKAEGIYESHLGSSLSGIESLVILSDLDLINLPFENLEVFQKIPSKSRDISLLHLGNRYEKINFNVNLNSSSGIERNKLKYINYDFKISTKEDGIDINATPIIQDCIKNNMKFVGVNSGDRIASIGEWQKYLSDGSLLFFYGHPSLFEIISPKTICDMIEISSVKGNFNF